MEDFGEASGLRTNLAKCSAHLICCSDEQAELAERELGCPIQSFSCTYLGLPLNPRKLTAAQIQPTVEKLGGKLSSWQASLLRRGGRLELVKTTLKAMMVFLMMAFDLSAKTIVAAEKIC